MGVLDGQSVNQAVTNAAFINKNQDDTMSNKLAFNRALSGATVSDIQAAVNRLYTASGVSETQTGTVYNATGGTITNGDTYQTAFTKLADKFDAATGHMHTGAAGDGPILNVVRTFAASGNALLTGDILLVAGAGVSLNQTGQDIVISATGGGGGGGTSGPIVTSNSTAGSSSISANSSIFWPYLTITLGDTLTIPSTSEIVGVTSIIINGTLIINGIGRIL